MVMMANGEYIGVQLINISENQIKFEKPAVSVSLFRDYDKKRFEIHLEMPWGSSYTIEAFHNESKAKKRYKYILRNLSTGRANIIIKGHKLSIVSGKR